MFKTGSKLLQVLIVNSLNWKINGSIPSMFRHDNAPVHQRGLLNQWFEDIYPKI